MERVKLDVTHAIACGAGLAAGLLAGYLLARKRAERGIEWRIASEIEQVRSFYEQRAVAAAAAVANASRKGDNPIDGPASVGSGEDEQAVHGPVDGSGAGRPDDADYRLPPPVPVDPPRPSARDEDSGEDGPLGEVPDDGDPEDLAGDDADQDDYPGGEDGADAGSDSDPREGRDRTHPYPISFEEYEGEEEAFSKICLVYFEADEVLADERESPIRLPASILGEGWEKGFGADGEAPHEIYFRNPKLSADYEVSRNLGSYAETVLGYVKPT